MAFGHQWGPSGPREGPSGPHEWGGENFDIGGGGKLQLKWVAKILTYEEEEEEQESLVLLTDV